MTSPPDHTAPAPAAPRTAEPPLQIPASPEPVVHPGRDAAAEAVADEIVALVERRPDTVLGVATGSTMTGVYRALVRRARERGLDVSRLTAFALDEYLGLPPGDPRLFRSVLEAHLVGDLGLDPSQLRTPDPERALDDPAGAAAAYEAALLDAGGVDLQLLGIGRNGHVAFNEPGSPPDSLTRTVELDGVTRDDAASSFGGLAATPRRAITVGVATILRARRLRLLAFGGAKAAILARALTGPVSPEVPASLLRGHPDLALHLDAEAAAAL